MKRRIIKQGHNTLTITIPRKWADQYMLKAGDEIDLIEKENIVLGETVEMYNRHKGGDYNYGFKRLSISRLNLNDEFRKAIEFTCKDISLMQLCFSAQAANVFNSAVNLMDETEVEGIELIQKHSRAIYKFMKREGAYNSKKHTRNRVRMSSVSGD
jgi:bifunctional DNA-binding transcriptional regulator/antitoxin component of YhaV-PrlF toxin-antitoxin module